MATSKDLVYELHNFIRVHKDGAVERLVVSPYVQPSLQHPIASKDVTISPHLSARLYLPKPTNSNHKLPIFAYFHGGGFFLGSAFTLDQHTYLNAMLSHVDALTVSVEYRLAPENPLPTAYQDCWAALQWIASHSDPTTHVHNPEPWLLQYGDCERLYVGGDSAGGNIAYNMALQAGRERLNNDVKILGAFLGCPFFWGKKSCDESEEFKSWMICCYPDAPGGIDNPMINPLGGRSLGCRKLLLVVAEKDGMREKAMEYYEAVKESGWDGEVEVVDVDGEGHCFYALDTNKEKAVGVLKRLASFIV